jgi:hypothetical protein
MDVLLPLPLFSAAPPPSFPRVTLTLTHSLSLSLSLSRARAPSALRAPGNRKIHKSRRRRGAKTGTETEVSPFDRSYGLRVIAGPFVPASPALNPENQLCVRQDFSREITNSRARGPDSVNARGIIGKCSGPARALKFSLWSTARFLRPFSF